MPLDAICLAALVCELEQAVAGGRIDKIHQPGRDEVVLALRSEGQARRLLLSANPSRPRLHLTTQARENPEAPPMFCMLLRKHLSGGRILAVTQEPMERVVRLELEATGELGDRVRRTLVLELVSARANLILLDEDGRIIDCLRRVEGDLTAHRQVLPGLFYRLPPAQDKVNPLELTLEEITARLGGVQAREPDKRLSETFCGISPLIARELSFRAGEGSGDSALAGQLFQLMEQVRQRRFSPCLLVREGKPADFSFLPILQYGPQTEVRVSDSFSRLLEEFYAARDSGERVRQWGQDLIKTVTAARDRTARRLASQARELESARDRERLRQQGDILTSNLHRMEKGMRLLKAQDYYDPEGGEIEIRLDPLLTPQQNAAKYYREYAKAKTAEAVLAEQLEKGRGELSYLESVLEALGRAEGERDVLEIRQELEDTGYARRASKAKGREKRQAARPMEFRSTAGLRISVGRNNTQNDQLTLKLAGKYDIWLHTQKIHGSHVILWTEGSQPDAGSLTEAAMLAAWFSQARGGQKVPVDYTPARYVKKPAGARPGMVVYSVYETAFVTPDEALVKRLRVK